MSHLDLKKYLVKFASLSFEMKNLESQAPPQSGLPSSLQSFGTKGF